MSDGYELVVPFGIDDGELDELSRQECFVLGVEWQMVSHLARAIDGPFSRPVHSRNSERIKKILEANGREYSLAFMHEDRSESWMWLEVLPRAGGEEGGSAVEE